VADHLIVSARGPGCDQGYALLWVDARRPGIRLSAMPLVNGRPCTELHFDHVPVSQADLLGEPDAGFRALQKALRYASLGLCSEVSGATAQALQDTYVLYANESNSAHRSRTCRPCGPSSRTWRSAAKWLGRQSAP
jgi:alkylation response protein AidB-like acyl-CoA dehydrogenase